MELSQRHGKLHGAAGVSIIYYVMDRPKCIRGLVEDVRQFETHRGNLSIISELRDRWLHLVSHVREVYNGVTLTSSADVILSKSAR